MQFNVGDQVVHASHGSGQIVAIEEKQFSGSEPRKFYAVATHKSTVWVPIESANGSSLRLLVTGDGLSRCRTLLKGQPTTLNANRRQRFLDVTGRLKGGSFEVLCEVIRDLSAFGWVKPLSDSDSSLFRKAQDDVCWEWAAVAGISVADVRKEILGLLQEGRKLHSA